MRKKNYCDNNGMCNAISSEVLKCKGGASHEAISFMCIYEDDYGCCTNDEIVYQSQSTDAESERGE